jgi:hypothetical protein
MYRILDYHSHFTPQWYDWLMNSLIDWLTGWEIDWFVVHWSLFLYHLLFLITGNA